MQANIYSYRILALALLVLPRVIWSCSCIGLSPERAFLDADAVFSGEPLDMVYIGELNPEHPGFVFNAYTFRVDESWKGVTSAIATVATMTQTTACGIHFESGNEYLIYAYIDGDYLRTSICARTRELSRASEDLEYLGLSDGALEQNYPNPFRANIGTTIRVGIRARGMASLTIYNILGHEIITLFDGNVETDTYALSWNGEDQKGTNAPPGVYFAVLTIHERRKSIKLVLLR